MPFRTQRLLIVVTPAIIDDTQQTTTRQLLAVYTPNADFTGNTKIYFKWHFPDSKSVQITKIISSYTHYNTDRADTEKFVFFFDTFGQTGTKHSYILIQDYSSSFNPVGYYEHSLSDSKILDAAYAQLRIYNWQVRRYELHSMIFALFKKQEGNEDLFQIVKIRIGPPTVFLETYNFRFTPYVSSHIAGAKLLLNQNNLDYSHPYSIYYGNYNSTTNFIMNSNINGADAATQKCLNFFTDIEFEDQNPTPTVWLPSGQNAVDLVNPAYSQFTQENNFSDDQNPTTTDITSNIQQKDNTGTCYESGDQVGNVYGYLQKRDLNITLSKPYFLFQEETLVDSIDVDLQFENTFSCREENFMRFIFEPVNFQTTLNNFTTYYDNSTTVDNVINTTMPIDPIVFNLTNVTDFSIFFKTDIVMNFTAASIFHRANYATTVLKNIPFCPKIVIHPQKTEVYHLIGNKFDLKLKDMYTIYPQAFENVWDRNYSQDFKISLKLNQSKTASTRTMTTATGEKIMEFPSELLGYDQNSRSIRNNALLNKAHQGFYSFQFYFNYTRKLVEMSACDDIFEKLQVNLTMKRPPQDNWKPLLFMFEPNPMEVEMVTQLSETMMLSYMIIDNNKDDLHKIDSVTLNNILLEPDRLTGIYQKDFLTIFLENRTNIFYLTIQVQADISSQFQGTTHSLQFQIVDEPQDDGYGLPYEPEKSEKYRVIFKFEEAAKKEKEKAKYYITEVKVQEEKEEIQEEEEGQEFSKLNYMSISPEGDLKVVFAQEMVVWNEGQVAYIDSVADLQDLNELLTALPFNISTQPGQYTDLDMFELISITKIVLEKKSLKLNIQFSNPEIVNMTPDPDQVAFIVSDSSFFVSLDRMPVKEGDFLISQLPTQLGQSEEAKQAQKQAKQTQNSIQSLLLSNAAVGLLMNLSLTSIWTMINSLQIIGYISMMPVNLPAKVNLYYGTVLKIVSFTLFETTDLFQRIFKFSIIDDTSSSSRRLLENDGPSLPGDGPLSSRLEQVGFESQYWIQNMSINFVVLTAQFFCILVSYILKLCLKTYPDPNKDESPEKCTGTWFKFQCTQLVEKSISIILTSIIELYMEISICFWVNFKSIRDNYQLINFSNSSTGDIINLIYCGVFGLIIMILPIYLMYKTRQNVDSIKHEELMAGLSWKFNLQRSMIIYPTLFMTRRQIFVVMALFFDDQDSSDPFLQVTMLIVIQMFICCYLLQTNPFGLKSKLRLEMINEVHILFQGYFILFYSGVITEIDTMLSMSNYMLTIFISQLFINTLYVLYVQITRIRKYIEFRAAQKLRKEMIDKYGFEYYRAFQLSKQKIDLNGVHFRYLSKSKGPRFAKENLHYLEREFPIIYDSQLLEKQIDIELESVKMMPDDMKLFVDFYKYCTGKQHSDFKLAYRYARRFFNIRRDFFYTSDWCAKVNGKLTNLLRMKDPEGPVPEYEGFWEKPRPTVILDMDEAQREEYLRKLAMPPPTLEQSIVHAKRMREWYRNNFSLASFEARRSIQTTLERLQVAEILDAGEWDVSKDHLVQQKVDISQQRWIETGSIKKKKSKKVQFEQDSPEEESKVWDTTYTHFNHSYEDNSIIRRSHMQQQPQVIQKSTEPLEWVTKKGYTMPKSSMQSFDRIDKITRDFHKRNKGYDPTRPYN